MINQKVKVKKRDPLEKPQLISPLQMTAWPYGVDPTQSQEEGLSANRAI
jgi:hypothetical protein